MVNEKATGAPPLLPRSEVGDPLDSVLLQLLDRLRASLFEQMAAVGLTPPQSMALRCITEAGPVPMRYVADQLSCDPSYVTVLADDLEGLGYIERRPDPADRRVKLLAATEAGGAALSALGAGLADRLPGSRTLAGRDRADLVDLLHKVLTP